MASAWASRGGREVRGQPGGRNPVAVALLPWRRTQLRTQDGGEVIVVQVARVGDPPAVLGLEVIGEAEEVVARLAVGAHDLLGLAQSVGPARVAVEVAAEEAALYSVSEQVLRHG